LSFIGTQIGALVDRDRAEKEIKQFEKFFSISMDLFCIANMDGYFKKINPKFSEILGYSEKELFSKSFVEFIHPDDIQATHQEIEKLSNRVESINFMNRYRCKNGEYRWFLWSSTPDPKSGLIYAAAKDITKQKKPEEILAALTSIQDTSIEEASSGETFEKMLNVLLRVTQSEYGFIGEVLYDTDDQPSLGTLAITNIS
jgi:PAS domain S-box-containing protein